MSKLVTLLNQLGSNASLAEAYNQDPEGLMTLAGLSDEEKALLKAGDLDAIKSATGLKSVVMNTLTVRAYE